MATATKLGPIGINQVNNKFYVGTNGGFNTIQEAVDYVKRYNGGVGQVIIVHGYPDDEPISSVINGMPGTYLSDQRDTLTQNYQWNGTHFDPADFRQIAQVASLTGVVRGYGFNPPDLAASHISIGRGGGGQDIAVQTFVCAAAPPDQKLWAIGAYSDKMVFTAAQDDGEDLWWLEAQRTGHQVQKVILYPPTDVQGVLTAQGSPVRTFANSPDGGGGITGGVNPATARKITFYQVAGSLVSGSNITSDVTGSDLDVPGVVSSEGSPVRTFANTPDAGAGGVDPGTVTAIPFYTAGSTVGETQITSDAATGTNLTVPGKHTAGQTVSSGGAAFPSGSSGGGFGASYVQDNKRYGTYGSGFSLGNAGGWSGAFGDLMNCYTGMRGIHQVRGGQLYKHGVGDCSGLYMYVRSDGGISAQSDEGVNGITAQAIENEGYFHGHVVSTTGTGDRAPVLAFDSGNNWTTDGAFMLNISKIAIGGRLTGPSAATTYTTFAGPQVLLPYHLPVNITFGTLPVSDAIGVVLGAIPNNDTTADRPVSTGLVVQLVQIGGVYKPFTVGGHVSVAGTSYPEQSFITAVGAVSGTKTQSITLALRNPNAQAIIFQGGIAGTYLSLEADLPYGSRTSYFAFGSLTGTDLIYGFTPFANMANGIVPKPDSEAATTDGGANAQFYLVPGAEVVRNNTDWSFDCTLEPNNVAWAPGDLVENPHYPAYSGGPAFFVMEQTTPSFGGAETCALSVLMEGNGIGGPGTSGMLIRNNRSPSHYKGHGGFCTAPDFIKGVGSFGHGMSFTSGPDTNKSLLFVQNPRLASEPTMSVIGLNYTNGTLLFDFVNQRYQVDSLYVAGNLGVGFNVNAGGGTHNLGNTNFTSDNNTNRIIFNGSPASGAGGVQQQIVAYAVGGTHALSMTTQNTGWYDWYIEDGGGIAHQVAKIDVNGLHVPSAGVEATKFTVPVADTGTAQFVIGSASGVIPVIRIGSGSALQYDVAGDYWKFFGNGLYTNNCYSNGYATSGGTGVAAATFTSADGKTVTVTNGLITSVV